MVLPTFEHVFYHLRMNSPDPDRLRYAQIAGAAARHAQGWRLTADEEAAAITELAEAAAGRADLLAERAGTALGFGEGRPDAARYQQIAELCIAAGADQALIERWIKIGRERAAAVAAIPYTGLPPGGLLLPLPRGLGRRCHGPGSPAGAAPDRRARDSRASRPRPGGSPGSDQVGREQPALKENYFQLDIAPSNFHAMNRAIWRIPSPIGSNLPGL
jgi:hypothetical protein